MRKLIYSDYTKKIKKGVGYIVDRLVQRMPVALHNHDFFEIEFIISTKNTKHTLNGREYLLENGHVHIINPSDIHSFDLDEDGFFERINVRFKQDAVSEGVLASVINNNCICKLSESEFNMISKLFEVLEYYYVNEATSPTAAEISSRIIESLIFMIRGCAAVDLGEEVNQKSQIQKILLYLHKNFKNTITLEEIARYSSFSPHYVSQLFHSETSMTLTQYITNLRLEYAKNLLFSTDHSVSEICTKCGFHSFAHFLRCFKSIYGTSPSKYRQKARSDSRNTEQ